MALGLGSAIRGARGGTSNRCRLGRHGRDALVLGTEAAGDRLGRALREATDVGAGVALRLAVATGLRGTAAGWLDGSAGWHDGTSRVAASGHQMSAADGVERANDQAG